VTAPFPERPVTVPDHDVPLPVKVTAGVSAPEKVTTGAVERLSLAVTDMVTVADELNGPVPDDPSRKVTAVAVGVAKARPGQANSTTAATATTHPMPTARAWSCSHNEGPRLRAGRMLAFRGGVLSPWAEATKVVEKHGARPGVSQLPEHHHDAMAPL
jgi:hypothetical protein